MVVLRSSLYSMPYHAQRVALLWRGMKMLQRSGAPLEPRPSSLVLLITNLKSIVGQYRGRVPGGSAAGWRNSQRRRGCCRRSPWGKWTDSERGSYISRATRTGRITCRVEGRRKRPRLLEAGITAMFDIIIVNLNAGSYLRMVP